MQIIDGKAVAMSVREALKGEVSALTAKGEVIGLAVVLVGEDSASRIYVRNKINACKEIGITSTLVELPESAREEEILDAVASLNNRDDVHGIIVQLPLPSHVNTDKVLASVKPEKDVDGCHYVQKGKLWTGVPETLPCTPYGCIELLKHYGIEIAGKNAVVVGRSNLALQRVLLSKVLFLLWSTALQKTRLYTLLSLTVRRLLLIRTLVLL